ncbi:ATP-grasp domain-containing protein [Streptomyces erythrochromogenes]|uniref:ATP-grasp domain-containing protein n=1 Tax=Streptomyces erythrochromogenes TaxID=285574 RepID=UPI00224ECEE3|nr:ATP-grasp domain-containing protein [Streptomyces erythrochromogenes]MCX5586279.1 ATP-grasp domain-containing protein [Streptomyces erythrochromogenes]
MTATRILVLGGKAVIVRKAAALGYEVVHVQKPSAFDPEVVPHCAQVLLVDYQDVPTVTALVRALHEQRPFARVFTQTEAAQVVAGHLTDTLGLPGNEARTNRLLHDKPALRALLNTRGIGPVPTLTAPGHEELRAFVAEHGGAVLKPTMGSGSLGVRKIESVAEVDAAWAWHEEFGVRDFMVEQLLVGRELSVEGFSVGGRHTIVAITGKDTGGGVVELGHVVPAPITGEEQESVRELVGSLLDAVGLVDGPSHTEVILTADGPRVIESHSRCGGDNINDLVRLVHGIDMEETTYLLADRDEPLSGPYPAEGAAAIRFLVAEPGRVTAVTGVDDARAAEGAFQVSVPLEIGDTVHELRWSEDRCGYVMAYAGDAAAAERLAAAAAAHITITTEPIDRAAQVRSTLGDILGEVDEELNPFAGTAAP